MIIILWYNSIEKIINKHLINIHTKATPKSCFFIVILKGGKNG